MEQYISEKDINFLINNISFKMIFAKGGKFQMKSGSWVFLQDFYMGEYEVTQELWSAVMKTNLYQHMKTGTSGAAYGVGDQYPMYYVNYYESVEFCRRISKKLENNLSAEYVFYIPSEAQWEYAARGGCLSRSFIYAGSNKISEVAYYSDNSNGTTHKVGNKEPNELGIYDMSGNVWEWCSDRFERNHQDSGISPSSDYMDSNQSLYNVLRGGGWYGFAESCRVDSFCYDSPCVQSMHIGFRLAMSKR